MQKIIYSDVSYICVAYIVSPLIGGKFVSIGQIHLCNTCYCPCTEENYKQQFHLCFLPRKCLSLRTHNLHRNTPTCYFNQWNEIWLGMWSKIISTNADGNRCNFVHHRYLFHSKYMNSIINLPHHTCVF